MTLFLLSFAGGLLTVLSPCVLPLLPVIIGGTLAGQHKFRPLVITASLAVSVVLFTLLLKFSTVFIHVPQTVWSTISGALVIGLGVVTLFPQLWDRVSARFNLSGRSDKLLQQSSAHNNLVGSVLIGFALGPVFSSCSPTYALILATVLPESIAVGTLNLVAYAVGLSAILLLISVFGQRLVRKLRWLANPRGAFKRALGILFIIVGVFIVFGWDKKIEASLIARGLGITSFEKNAVDQIRALGTGAGFLNLDIDTSNARSNTGAEMNVRTPVEAPEITGIDVWINSNPLTLEQLKGKVVMLDFWTYTCINCIRTLPHLNAWYESYADDGLVIIGVHSPEFSFEHDLANVQAAVTENSVQYPVALDNDFLTWRAYNNRYWPAAYFIDREGKVRHTHFGEGDYEENEKVIRALLAEGGHAVTGQMTDIADDGSFQQNQTPETYLGYERATRFVNEDEVVEDNEHTYALHEALNQNEWSIGGTWTVQDEKIIAGSDAVLRLRFTAKNVYLVMGSSTITPVDVFVDGIAQQQVTIQQYSIYPVVSGDTQYSGSTVELRFQPGTELNAFTFGS